MGRDSFFFVVRGQPLNLSFQLYDVDDNLISTYQKIKRKIIAEDHEGDEKFLQQL